MDSSKPTLQLVPVFVEMKAGRDIKTLLFVKDEKGVCRSLAEMESASEAKDSEVVPGVLTTSLNETYNADGSTTTASVSVSPFRVCCFWSGGIKICYPC